MILLLITLIESETAVVKFAIALESDKKVSVQTVITLCIILHSQ